jgi:hypothetical protein
MEDGRTESNFDWDGDPNVAWIGSTRVPADFVGANEEGFFFLGDQLIQPPES